MTKSFTGEEFAKALAEGALKEPIVKIGMVKKDEGGPSAILFAEGAACASWVRIPVGLIEEVKHLTTIRCRDHEHPLVQIRLKEPAADNEAARVFVELARRSSPRPPCGPGEAHPDASPGQIFLRAGGSPFGRRFLPGIDPLPPETPPGWCYDACRWISDLCERSGYGSRYCSSIHWECLGNCGRGPSLF